MTDLRKYSKEWFATHGSQNQKNAIKKLKGQEFTKMQNEGKLSKQILNADTLLGSKNDVRGKFNNLSQESNEAKLINRLGGIDTIFDVVDENRDGEISNEEILSAAAVDTADWAIEDSIIFSAQDLQKIYTNTVLADGVEVKTEGQKTYYNYKNGSKTEIEYDSQGNIKTKKSNDMLVGNQKRETVYNYDEKLKTEKIFDSQGRIKSEEIDKPGTVNDVFTTIKYNETETIKTKYTVGRIENKVYNQQGNLKQKNVTYRYNINGEIEASKQQNVGDCWLLSQVNTLRDTAIGKNIIKNSIHKNNNGTVTVELKGVQRQYIFTPEQIMSQDYNVDKGQYYSSGDDDMRLIEMAIRNYREEVIITKGEEFVKRNLSNTATLEDPLKAGRSKEAIVYLTGIEPIEATSKKKIQAQLNQKQQNSDRYTLTVVFKEETRDFGVYEKDNAGKSKIITGHQYSISRVTEDVVFVVNPWDSSEEIPYPKDKFLKNCIKTATADLNQYNIN